MGLENLNDQLYSRNQADERAKVENPYEPDLQTNLRENNINRLEVDGQSWSSLPPRPAGFGEKLKFWWAEHHRRIYLVGGVLAILAILAGVSWYGYKQFFSEQNTLIGITVEEQAKSGENVTPSVTVRTENRTALENVKVIIELPAGFVADVPLDDWTIQGRRAEKLVGTLTRNQEAEVNLPGKIFGSKGAVATFKAIAEYSPAKISGVYEVSAEANTVVLSSPLTLQVTGPQELVTGQDLEYEVIYKNESNETFDNVRLKAFFPSGFTFKGSTPATSSFDTWNLNTFRPGDTGKIIVRGSLEGVWNEQKDVRFGLGYEAGGGEFISYNEGSASTKMIASPLSIKQVVNDNDGNPAAPGTVLTYDIQYQNNSTQGYRDAIVSIVFENPEFLDWENLDLPQGAYDQATKSITWKAGDIQELRVLAPGALGNLTFRIPVISDFSSVGIVKNRAIVSRVTIDSPDIQTTLSQNKLIGSSTANIALGTLVGFQILAYHEHPSMDTDGPLPPEVGEKTEYVLRLRVTNPANDVTQGKVMVTFPGYMKFTGKKNPDESNVSYNDRVNEVTWTLGTLSPGSSKEVYIQTEFAPGENLADKDFQMFQSATFTGVDSFTKQNISLPLTPKSNNLSDEGGDLPNGYNRVKR